MTWILKTGTSVDLYQMPEYFRVDMKKIEDLSVFMLGRHDNHPETLPLALSSYTTSTAVNFTQSLGVTMMTQGSSLEVVDHDLHCSRGALLGPLGLFVQFLLAFIAFTSLVGK